MEAAREVHIEGTIGPQQLSHLLATQHLSPHGEGETPGIEMSARRSRAWPSSEMALETACRLYARGSWFWLEKAFFLLSCLCSYGSVYSMKNEKDVISSGSRSVSRGDPVRHI